MIRTLKKSSTSIDRNESTIGKTLEQELEIMMANGEEIGDQKTEPIYTERKEGVKDAFNIRHDKWITAQKAMQKVGQSYEAKRQKAQEERENPEPLQEKGEVKD